MESLETLVTRAIGGIRMTKSSLLTKIPENTSFLQPTKYSMEFPTLPFLRYFCQSANIPSISTSAVTVSSPFADMKRHGDKLVYDQLVVTALIDEDMRVWEEIYDWLQALTKPDRYEQYVRFYERQKDPYHDSVLTINTNANNPNIRFKFTHCHPVSLGAVSFSTTENANVQIHADIVFAYDQYYVTRLTS